MMPRRSRVTRNYEIAGWVATRGVGVIVLEPAELKEQVIEIAKGILKNYNS